MSEPASLPRKVLMTTDTVGGVWNYSLELARGLAEKGIEVALATMGAPINELQRDKVDRIPGLRVFESHFKLEWMDDPWRDVDKAGDWLLNLESRIGPDVVHLNGYVHGGLPWNAPTVMVGHSCVLSWWRAVKGEDAPDEWDRYQMEVAAGLHAADLVVAPSAAMLAALTEHYGDLGQTRVIPNGRDAGLFRPSAKEPMVFSAGRLWDEAKNLEALERVARRLPWPIFVAGDNHHPEGGEIRPHNTRLLGRLSRHHPRRLGRPRLDLRPPRPLRAVRPLGPRSRPRRLRPRARRHPEPARDLAQPGRLRGAERSRGPGAGDALPDQRSGAPPVAGRRSPLASPRAHSRAHGRRLSRRLRRRPGRPPGRARGRGRAVRAEGGGLGKP